MTADTHPAAVGFDASALESATGKPVPWKSRLVNIVRIAADGTIGTGHSIAWKREVIATSGPGDVVLLAWPGNYSQEIFRVDDLTEMRDYIGPVR